MVFIEESSRHRLEQDALARALELVASCVERPISAFQALNAVESELIAADDRSWLDPVSSLARSLSLATYTREASARDLLELSGRTAVLGRGMAGEWLLVTGRRHRRLIVTVFDEHGQRRQAMSVSGLDRRVGGIGSWMYFEPLLELDPIADHGYGSEGRRVWSRLATLVRIERRELWLVVIYAVVIGAMTLATPIAVQAVVNTIAFGAVLQPLVVLSLMLLAGLVFAAVLQVLEAFVVEVIQRRVFVRVAQDFGRRLPWVQDSVRGDCYLPERVNRFFDVLTIQKSAASLLMDGLSLLLQSVLGMLLLAFYHPLLLGFGGVLVLLLTVVIFMGWGATRSALLESKAKYATAAWLEDLARVPTLFKGARAGQYAALRTEALCRDYLIARRSHYRILLRQIAGGLGLQVFAMVSLLGVGGWLVMQRQLTLGQLVAAELVIGAVAAGFAKLGLQLEKAYDLLVAVDKIGGVVDLASERRGGEAPGQEGPASLCLRGVRIDRAQKVLLKDAQIEVKRGARILLRGAPASGKSALIDVLGGLREPEEGVVLLDRVDLRHVDLGLARDQVAIVRGVELIAGSILDNLSIGTCSVSEASMRELLALVGIEDAIDALPQGLASTLMPSGAPLSSSQARRLVLARALARRPRALLLDGALDGLGLESVQLQKLLAKVLGAEAPWTALVVSDDPRVAKWCERVIRIEDRSLLEVQ